MCLWDLLNDFGTIRRMKTLLVLYLSFCLSVLSVSAVDVDSFRNPDRSCRPETWFHLIGGNVSKEGMDADLDAIANAGISGIHLFHGRSDHGEWPNVKKQIPCLSEDWDDLIRFVADGCEKRGLIFKMQNCFIKCQAAYMSELICWLRIR